jgi:hypothetical protein
LGITSSRVPGTRPGAHRTPEPAMATKVPHPPDAVVWMNTPTGLGPLKGRAVAREEPVAGHVDSEPAIAEYAPLVGERDVAHNSSREGGPNFSAALLYCWS